MNPRWLEKSPPWLIALCIIGFLAAYGLVGRWDYEAARVYECASFGKDWNSSTDKCERRK